MAMKETMNTGRRTREYNCFWQSMLQIKDALVDDDAARKILVVKFADAGWMQSDSKANTAIDLAKKALNVIEKYPSQYEVMRKMMEDVGLSFTLPKLDESDPDQEGLEKPGSRDQKSQIKPGSGKMKEQTDPDSGFSGISHFSRRGSDGNVPLFDSGAGFRRRVKSAPPTKAHDIYGSHNPTAYTHKQYKRPLGVLVKPIPEEDTVGSSHSPILQAKLREKEKEVKEKEKEIEFLKQNIKKEVAAKKELDQEEKALKKKFNELQESAKIKEENNEKKIDDHRNRIAELEKEKTEGELEHAREVGNLKKDIARLKANEEKNDQEINDYRKRIAELEKESEVDHASEVERLQEVIACLKTKQEKIEKEINDCRKRIAELEEEKRESELRHTEEVERLEEVIACLRQEIKDDETNTEIKTLRLQVKLGEAEKKVAENKSTILERENKIQELQARIDLELKDAKIQELEEALQKKTPTEGMAELSSDRN